MKKHLRSLFKCKCADYIYHKATGEYMMKGGWVFHMNLIHSLSPQGLNREFYRMDLNNNKPRKIKYHYNKSARKF